MKFSAAAVASTLAVTASAVALPSLGSANGAVGPFAIKIVSSNIKYNGKSVALTSIKDDLTMATVNAGFQPIARFYTNNLSHLVASVGVAPVLFRGAPTVYEAAFSNRRVLGQTARPVYFVASSDFGSDGPTSAVQGYDLQMDFGIDGENVTRGGKTDVFYACSGMNTEGTEKEYDAIMIGEKNPLVPSCEKVQLVVSMLSGSS